MSNFYHFTQFAMYPALIHAVSTKSVNKPYAFSLALHTGEERHQIVSNRNEIEKMFTLKNTLHFIVANQTHSDHIHIVKDKETKGWKNEKDAIQDCDALITNLKHVVLAILTADCVPILLYDKKQHIIAAIHAGWKGTHHHITAKTIKKMQTHFNSDTKDIIAGIAPSIGICCYEVGKEVAQNFFAYRDCLREKNDKYMLNLPLVNKEQLLKSGILLENIEMSHICTACEVTKFFSYRKEKGCTGRFMSMIGLKDRDAN